MATNTHESQLDVLIQTLRMGRSSDRQAALKALGALGLEAVDAVPALIQTLTDRLPGIRLAAADTLRRIGTPAVPLMLQALQEDHTTQRRAIIVSLGRMGSSALGALPVLTQLLDDPLVRTEAVEAVENIQGAPRKTLRRVIRQVEYWAFFGAVVVTIMAIVIGTISRVFYQSRGVPLMAALGWGVLGAMFGILVGATRQGRHATVPWAIIIGFGGALGGGLIGGVLGVIFEAVISVLAP